MGDKRENLKHSLEENTVYWRTFYSSSQALPAQRMKNWQEHTQSGCHIHWETKDPAQNVQEGGLTMAEAWELLQIQQVGYKTCLSTEERIYAGPYVNNSGMVLGTYRSHVIWTPILPTALLESLLRLFTHKLRVWVW